LLGFWKVQNPSNKFRVFENGMFRRMSGHEREEVTGGATKLHDEELLNLCSSRNIIAMIKSGG
jgi:hypothetical protein